MSAAPQDDAADERLELFTTLRDWFRHAVSRFNAAGLAYGHGTTRAVDEAAFIVLEGLRLPIDQLDPFFDAKLVPEERRRLAELIDARIATRKPAAYLLGRAYIQGVPFYVDERVIVPRSFIGELLFAGLVGEGGLIAAPEAVASVLDLCTGGASLAVLAARAFPNARLDAVDLSADALEVARRNVADHGLAERIALLQGDLYEPLGERRYDLILANPPYVDAEFARRLSPRIFRRAASGPRGRERRPGHRAADFGAHARVSRAGRGARLRDRAGAGAPGSRVSRLSADMARHAGERGRGVLPPRERLAAPEPPGEAAAVSQGRRGE